MISQQFPTSPAAQLPFHSRYNEALLAPLYQRCLKLTELIHDSLLNNPRDIHTKYVNLVENIFGFVPPGSYSFGTQSDWMLRTLTRSSPAEFNSVVEFLSANGMLFKLIKNIMNDPSNRYDFHIECLSSNTIAQFKEGMIPPFFLNKFPASPNVISLNAFEFYMFHFAYYITNTNTMKKLSTLNCDNENTDVVYHNLLQNYLKTFFPDSPIGQNSADGFTNSLSSTNHQATPSIWKALSSTTTNLLNLSALKTHPHDAHTPDSKTQILSQTPRNAFQRPSFQSPNTESRLFSPVMLQNRQNMNPSVITNIDSDSIGTQIYKCETMINIFTEFWLNHAPEKHQTVEISSSFTFTVDHMRAIRVMIKHFHLFTSRAARRKADNFGSASFMHHSQLNSGGFVHSSFSDPLEELRANLWTSKYPIQRKLYSLIKLAFERWHNDSSFRIPLEAWLSYIQPWRYLKYKHQSSNGNNKENNDNSNSNNINNKGDDDSANSNVDLNDWRRFIQENLFFYTVIFKQVLMRIANILDLNVSSAAHFLFRLTKVFKKAGLIDIIRESELLFLRSANFGISPQHVSFNQSSSSSSPMKSSSKSISSMSKSILLDLDPTTAHESVFSPAFRDFTMSLLRKIARQMYLLDGQASLKTDRSDGSFVATLSKFFMLDGDTGAGTFSAESAKANNIAKTKHHFEVSIKSLAEILSITDESVSIILSREQTLASAGDQLDSSSNADIYEQIDDGFARLNDKGRQLVTSGALDRRLLKHFTDFNPDTQPARSFECSFIVPITIMLSNIVNERFGSKLGDLYTQDNIIGKFMRMLLAPPTKYVEYVKTSVERRHAQEIIIKQLPARVNLRFLSWYIWLVFAGLFILYLLFSFAPTLISVTAMICIFFITIIWTVVNVLST